MAPHEGGLWELILIASPFAKFILLVLAAMSVASWTIILEKFLLMARVKRANAGLSHYRWSSFDARSLAAEARRYSAAFVSKAYIHVHRELLDRSDYNVDSELVAREFSRAVTSELNRAEKLLPFLATCSSAGPFLGLLGTVWGIISAFQRIGVWGGANIAVVAPGIAEALVATAVGLFAAIPALVAYNFISNWLRKESERAEAFGDDLAYAIQKSSSRTPTATRVRPAP